MRKAIAILFLFVYLSSSSEFAQLFKMPVIWEHFHEHRAANNHLSFFAFLKMHYFNGDPKDADYQRDMQLPFKTPLHSFIAFTATVVQVNSTELPLLPFAEKTVIFPTDDNRQSSLFLSSIWQPPKV